MSDLISRKAAIDAIKAIKYGLWEIDIPSPTVPEYVEHHEQIANMMGVCDNWLERIGSLPSAQPEHRWIPVKYRPMDAEERAYWQDHFGYELSDEDAVMFDCKMPDDGQEILVSYCKWVCIDKCEIDGGCYGLEGNGDWDGVVAWMPLPEPYREEGKK